MNTINKYIKNLNRIEFVISSDCTGCCKHCSQGDHPHTGVFIDPDIASKLVKDVSKKYNITSVMTFGGEPLLYPQSVYAIHSAATNSGILKRQLITNGYFTKNTAVIKAVVENIKKSGVNDLLLSVDAFHQETIPFDIVKYFALTSLDSEVNIRLNPAWLVCKEHKNIYNQKTESIVSELSCLGVPESNGNIIFPEGNAIKNLSEYFDSNADYINPYTENPNDLKTISINPDGTLFEFSVYKNNILDILDRYHP